MTEACVCVFAKAPVEGRVKTRLLPVLTEQQACRVHKNLLKHCLASTKNPHWQSQLWSTDIDHPYIEKSSKKYSMPLFLQEGHDLGEKMYFAVQHGLKTFSYVIIIGSDCPSLDVAIIANAIDALKSGLEVVLVPAEDGGYVLIGLSIEAESVFKNMQWGNDQVLMITRKRLKAAKLSWRELSAQRDIDRPEDLEYLAQQYPQLITQ